MSCGKMKMSLYGLGLSTRLSNVLGSMADTPANGIVQWSDVVRVYQTTPGILQMRFLRTPGGGQKTWAELQRKLIKLCEDPRLELEPGVYKLTETLDLSQPADVINAVLKAAYQGE